MEGGRAGAEVEGEADSLPSRSLIWEGAGTGLDPRALRSWPEPKADP